MKPRTFVVARHESGQPLGQAVRQAPQRHPFPRPARLQVGCVGRVDGETRAGCLAEGERGARVIDVVVREDDPIDPAQGLCLDEAKDGAEAAGVTGVDNGKTFAALVQIGLRAANAWNPANHIPIIYGRRIPGCGTSTGAGGGSWISGWGGCGASSGPGGSPTSGLPGLGITGSGMPGSFSIAPSLA